MTTRDGVCCGSSRRGSGSVVTWRRAQMVLLSAQGMDVAAIAKVAFTSEDRVQDVIHNFNADGFRSLDPRYRGGRSLKFTLAQRREIKKTLDAVRELGGIALDRPLVAHPVARLPDGAVPRRDDDATIQHAEPVQEAVVAQRSRQLVDARGGAVCRWPQSEGSRGASISATGRPWILVRCSGTLPSRLHLLVESPGGTAIARFHGSPRERLRGDVGEDPPGRYTLLE